MRARYAPHARKHRPSSGLRQLCDDIEIDIRLAAKILTKLPHNSTAGLTDKICFQPSLHQIFARLKLNATPDKPAVASPALFVSRPRRSRSRALRLVSHRFAISEYPGQPLDSKQ